MTYNISGLLKIVSLTWAAALLPGCFSLSVPHPIEQRVEFSTLLAPDDPLVSSSVLIAGMGTRRDQIVLCNGVYFEKNWVLTAGHCLREDFTYFAFVPVQVKRENPYTFIRLEPAGVLTHVQHEEFMFKFEEGLVENDIGLVHIAPPEFHLLKPAPLLPHAKKLPEPKNIEWRAQRSDGFFAVQPPNLIEISGYKFERDQISQGLNLIRDSASFVGSMPHTQSHLASLNPGTSIHRGVSGSGLYWREGGHYYLSGIVSVYYPGVNLLTATNIAQFHPWIEQKMQSTNHDKE